MESGRICRGFDLAVIAGSAISGGIWRSLALAAGVAAMVSVGCDFAAAADYAAGGGVVNAPSGFATAVGSGATTLGTGATVAGVGLRLMPAGARTVQIRLATAGPWLVCTVGGGMIVIAGLVQY